MTEKEFDIPRPDRWMRSRANDNPLAAAVVLSATLAAWFLSGTPVPEILTDPPRAVWVAVAAGVAGAPIGAVTGRKLVDLLYNPDRILLVDVAGGAGDIAVYVLSPSLWRDVDIRSPAGKDLERSDLLRIDSVKYDRAYEVIAFDADERVATASPAAGLSEIELREHEHAVESIIEDLAPLADSYTELRSALRPMIRDILGDIVTWQISVLEGTDVPRGDVITEAIDGTVDNIDEEFPDPAPIDFDDDDDSNSDADADRDG